MAEIDAQWQEIRSIESSVDLKMDALREDESNEDIAINLAYKLHNLYSAYEDMFKLVARFFENQIDDLATYHIGLLKRMLISIEGIRPNFLSKTSFKILDELRGFRHVFRHAYSYELDGERILQLAEKSKKLRSSFSNDFTMFQSKLRG